MVSLVKASPWAGVLTAGAACARQAREERATTSVKIVYQKTVVPWKHEELVFCPSCGQEVPYSWLDGAGCQAPGCTY
jgi:hypothetical protein